MRKILTLLMMVFICIASQAATSFYLTGTFNGWKPDQSQYQFKESNGIYTLKVSSLTGDFKVTTSDWSQQFGCDSPIEYGKTYKCVRASNGHNMILSEGTANNILITFDLANQTVRVDGNATLYLVGISTTGRHPRFMLSITAMVYIPFSPVTSAAISR